MCWERRSWLAARLHAWSQHTWYSLRASTPDRLASQLWICLHLSSQLSSQDKSSSPSSFFFFIFFYNIFSKHIFSLLKNIFLRKTLPSALFKGGVCRSFFRKSPNIFSNEFGKIEIIPSSERKTWLVSHSCWNFSYVPNYDVPSSHIKPSCIGRAYFINQKILGIGSVLVNDLQTLRPPLRKSHLVRFF